MRQISDILLIVLNKISTATPRSMAVPNMHLVLPKHTNVLLPRLFSSTRIAFSILFGCLRSISYDKLWTGAKSHRINLYVHVYHFNFHQLLYILTFSTDNMPTNYGITNSGKKTTASNIWTRSCRCSGK